MGAAWIVGLAWKPVNQALSMMHEGLWRYRGLTGHAMPRAFSGEYFLSDLTKLRNYFDARSAFCSSSVKATLLRR